MSGAAGGGAGAGAVVRQGHLRKLKTMKKKYFVLRAEASDGARLEYYESEKKFRAGAAPRRVVPLKSCYNITRRLDLKQKHVIALFTREEQFCVAAENEKELHEWLAAILKQHGSDDASEELLHPIQHVWQVNVQKKGLGTSKNIQGLYNLCLTDKTLTLVKIKSHNNVIRELAVPERIEYSLKYIRRCGDSECFFYMEVGRQTSTGAGELWMHSDDSNIAQSMHSTIYHAMKNCKEDERDHIPLPKNRSLDGSNPPRDRSQSLYSDSKKGRSGLSNDSGPRSRCDSMPAASRASSSFEAERTPARHNDHIDGLETSRDEPDALSEWYRTPRIPEEPDSVDVAKDFMSSGLNAMSVLSSAMPMVQHSRTSSLGVEEEARVCGYLPMAPHEPSGLVSASSGSVCSGTPSTDPRFSEYQLEPATSHIVDGCRPPRAYSVGSRPTRPDPPRHRAYSVGAQHARPAVRPTPSSAPLLPRASAEDLMELDFSANSANSANSQHTKSSLASLAYTGHRSGSPSTKVVVARTPPATIGFCERRAVDEYVAMSPRNAGYVEMRPGDPPPTLTTLSVLSALSSPSAPDGYVEMNYTRAPTKPIAITQRVIPPPASVADNAMPPPALRAPLGSPPRGRSPPRTPLGSQTLFPLSLDSPASPPEVEDKDIFDDDIHEPLQHPLSTVREISEEGRRSPSPRGEESCSPQYVLLARGNPSRPIAAPGGNLTRPATGPPAADLPGNPTANKTLARLPSQTAAESSSTTATLVVATPAAAPARFVVSPPADAMPADPLSAPLSAPLSSPLSAPLPAPLNYAALDLEPRRSASSQPLRTYSQIDFVRSEKLAADGS